MMGKEESESRHGIFGELSKSQHHGGRGDPGTSGLMRKKCHYSARSEHRSLQRSLEASSWFSLAGSAAHSLLQPTLRPTHVPSLFNRMRGLFASQGTFGQAVARRINTTTRNNQEQEVLSKVKVPCITCHQDILRKDHESHEKLCEARKDGMPSTWS